eukprot:COSAG01_NODE_7795_length_3053_cov_29.913676_3_plen_134_part_00
MCAVVPRLLGLQELLYLRCRRSDALLQMSAKPLYRFINLLLAQVGCARYVLLNHCRSAAEVKPVARLMSLGDSPVTDELEGLTNQAAALLAVVAEEELGNTQYVLPPPPHHRHIPTRNADLTENALRGRGRSA